MNRYFLSCLNSDTLKEKNGVKSRKIERAFYPGLWSKKEIKVLLSRVKRLFAAQNIFHKKNI